MTKITSTGFSIKALPGHPEYPGTVSAIDESFSEGGEALSDEIESYAWMGVDYAEEEEEFAFEIDEW